jgi:hypothetical protein
MAHNRLFALTPCSRVFSGQLTVPQLREKSPQFVETGSSVPHSQQPAICPILNQMNPVCTLSSYTFKNYFNIILPSKLDLSSRLFPSGLHTNCM